MATKLARATIDALWQETPTVKGLRLKLDTLGSLDFQPGQWVDFHAPSCPAVGGYSICSTPAELQASGALDLCVKASRHPCAQWVHSQAAPGDQVSVQVGGSFTLAPHNGGTQPPALFVAGGIGITCLSSMMGQLAAEQYQRRQHQQYQHPALPPPPLLLYSAASPDEFALLPRLLEWQQQGLLQLQLHTTQLHGVPPAVQQLQQQQQRHQQQAGQRPSPPGPDMHKGRISQADLAQAVQRSSGGSSASSGGVGLDAYVCGPPRMTDEVVALLEDLGVAQDSIRTEKWW